MTDQELRNLEKIIQECRARGDIEQAEEHEIALKMFREIAEQRSDK